MILSAWLVSAVIRPGRHQSGGFLTVHFSRGQNMETKIVRNNAIRRVECSGAPRALSVTSSRSGLSSAAPYTPYVHTPATLATLTGRVAPLCTYCIPQGGAKREMIGGYAFDRGLSDGRPVTFTINHDHASVITDAVRLSIADDALVDTPSVAGPA